MRFDFKTNIISIFGFKVDKIQNKTTEVFEVRKLEN